jgi:hypothetical protein
VIAQHMAGLGAHVGAMTPGELAEWVAQKVRRNEATAVSA